MPYATQVLVQADTSNVNQVVFTMQILARAFLIVLRLADSISPGRFLLLLLEVFICPLARNHILHQCKFSNVTQSWLLIEIAAAAIVKSTGKEG